MIINNSISADTYTERAERLQLLSTNIDTYAVELAISGARLASAQNADAEWDNACAKGVVEAGQKDEAYEEFNKAVGAASKYYSAAKGHLLTIIYEVGGKPDDYINRYGFNVDSPRKYKPTTAAIEAWKLEHDRLVALPDPRVISDAIMTILLAHKTGIDGLSQVAFIEKQEADTAFDEKKALFDAQTNLLQFVLTAAVLTWGNEDPRLNLLGFKPKSEIWTEGGGTSPEIGIPQNLAAVIEGENVRISWDAVDGADSYQLVHTEFPPLFLGLYDGDETEFVHINPPGGTHYYNVRAKKGDSYSEYGDAVSVEITGVKPEPPQNLQLEHIAPYVKVTWESPPSTPEYFRLYIASVPTGDPPPDMPSEPDTDELITLSVSIFAPGPGKTLYVWITSFGDGEESEPCGPESIDIM